MSLSIKKNVSDALGKSNTISVWTLSLPCQPAGGDRAASEDMVPKPKNKGGLPEYFCVNIQRTKVNFLNTFVLISEEERSIFYIFLW